MKSPEINLHSEITLTMEVQEFNILLAALQELPARLVNPLLTKLASQAAEQLENNPEEGRNIQLSILDGTIPLEHFG